MTSEEIIKAQGEQIEMLASIVKQLHDVLSRQYDPYDYRFSYAHDKIKELNKSIESCRPVLKEEDETEDDREFIRMLEENL